MFQVDAVHRHSRKLMDDLVDDVHKEASEDLAAIANVSSLPVMQVYNMILLISIYQIIRGASGFDF